MVESIIFEVMTDYSDRHLKAFGCGMESDLREMFSELCAEFVASKKRKMFTVWQLLHFIYLRQIYLPESQLIYIDTYSESRWRIIGDGKSVKGSLPIPPIISSKEIILIHTWTNKQLWIWRVSTMTNLEELTQVSKLRSSLF